VNVYPPANVVEKVAMSLAAIQLKLSWKFCHHLIGLIFVTNF